MTFFNFHFSSLWVIRWLTQRAEEGLSTISRIGIDATFKVYRWILKIILLCLLISTVSIKVTPGNFAQLLILHAHIGGALLSWFPIWFPTYILQTHFGLHFSIASCPGVQRRSTPRPLSWSTPPAPSLGLLTSTSWWTLRCTSFPSPHNSMQQLSNDATIIKWRSHVPRCPY